LRGQHESVARFGVVGRSCSGMADRSAQNDARAEETCAGYCSSTPGFRWTASRDNISSIPGASTMASSSDPGDPGRSCAKR
jgi:hypothetical protein